MNVHDVFREYLDALVAGDRAACQRIVEGLLDAGTDLKSIYVDLFQGSMYRIGELWERNVISVAVEHMATSITESLLPLVYGRLFGRPHVERSALIACVPSEFHQIGVHIIADFFELHGWHGHCLGANTPVDGLVAAVGDMGPDVVGLSASLAYNLPVLSDMLEAVATHHPGTAILLGGRALTFGQGEFSPAALEQRFPQATYVASIEALEAYIKSPRWRNGT